MTVPVTKKLLSVGILILAIIIWLYNFSLFFPKSSPLKKTSDHNLAKETIKSSESYSPKPSRFSSFTYEAKYKDPFTPFFTQIKPVKGKITKPTIKKQEENPPRYTLSGILWEKKIPLAVVIDSTGESFVVREGDVLNNIRVIKITKNELWYKYKDKTVKVVLDEK